MTPTERIPTLAIVGGGASGVLVAIQALRHARSAMRIVVIEQHNEPGRGIAYGTSDHNHVLNVRSDNMSAYPDAPDHFRRWLQQLHPTFDLTGDSFAPRVWYGDYLQSELTSAIAQRESHVEYTVLHGQATGVAVSETEVTIQLANGDTWHADQVVLALGNLPSANPFSTVNGAGACTRLLTAYDWHEVTARVSACDAVVLLGTGLTMVDTALALHAQGHRAPITAVSRHGLLPQAHRPRQPYSSRLAEQFGRTTTVRAILRLVRQEARKAAVEGIAWQSVLDTLRPTTQRLWRDLPDVERRRFLRHVRAYWDSHRHRTSPNVIRVIDDMRRSSQLTVRAGRVLNYCEDSDGVEVVVQPRSSATMTRLRVAYVVNCTGSTCDYATTTEPLVVQLREQGLLQPDTLGLGVQADADGRLMGANGQVSARLSTLGPPLRGMLWECTSIPDIRVQALSLAQRIVGDLERAQAVPVTPR